MAIDLKAAQDFTAELSKALDRVPPYSMGDSTVAAARNAEFNKITDLIEAKGGAVKVRHDGVTVRAFGIRASSTSGLMQACQNWKSQVTLKSMAAQMGGDA